MSNEPAFPMGDKCVSVLSIPTHNQIAAKAYELWLQNGPQNSRCIDYWFRAEELLLQETALGLHGGSASRDLSWRSSATGFDSLT